MNPDVMKAALDAIESGDVQKMADALKAVLADAAGSGEAAIEAPEGLAGAADAKPEDAMSEPDKAALSALLRITGTNGPGEAVDALKKMHATVAKLRADSEAIELAQRRELIGELVKLGAEVPATAWQGDPLKMIPAPRLSAEPIAELRDRVTKLRAGRPVVANLAPPVDCGLSDDEERLTARMTPDQKKRFTALRASRRAS